MSKGRDIKPHIGIFGRRNNGKSSFINVLVGQEVAIVSEKPGTTTDPVKKSLEIFGIGPAIIIDTAGIDDSGDLGEKRIKKTLEILKVIDVAVLILADNIFNEYEINLVKQFNSFDIPYILIHNKSDVAPLNEITRREIKKYTPSRVIDFSAIDPHNTEEVLDLLMTTIPKTAYQDITLFKGLVQDRDIVVLVTPIDNEAPEARMILPQVMAIRDVLDNNCINVVLKETELEYFLKTTGIRPKMVVTDSQAFSKVSKIVPQDIPLTGFSVLFARLKGDFEAYLKGTPKISELKDGDRILILESCSHRVNCDDIGRFKIPRWFREFTKKELEFEFISSFENHQHPINEYALVVHCGGCVFTRKQVLNRLKPAIEAGVPVTNYGLAIGYTQGIFERVTAPFRVKEPTPI